MSNQRSAFRPPWWATLGTIVVGGIFVTAGLWQLRRGEEKHLLFATFDAGNAGATFAAPAAGADLARLRYSMIRATGSFDAGHQLLLDARTRDGKAGYEVLTPLLRPFPDNGPAILVNRGWLPADADRNRLPEVSVATQPRTVIGLLDHLPRAALSAGPAVPDKEAPWPRRMLYPTTEEISAALGYPVEHYELLLSRDAPDGYLREWRPAVMTARQHVGYAVQWFAMAAALVVLYVVLNVRKSAVLRSR